MVEMVQKRDTDSVIAFLRRMIRTLIASRVTNAATGEWEMPKVALKGFLFGTEICQ